MIFRQLIEPDSNTYTYLLACPETGQALLIDPVLDTLQRDLDVLQKLDLKLMYTLDTHHHADHLTSARLLRERTGCQVVYPAVEKPDCADIGISEGQPFKMGSVELSPLFTPGHTSHHHAYLLDNGTQKMLFSGDALLIEACGRTDFQSGDAATLYRSIHEKLFSLPDETLVYPGHDYEGRFVSSIAQEKVRNPRLGGGKTLEEFVSIMNGLDLPYPRKIDFAVPGNELCGTCPPNVPEEYRGPCDLHEQG
ncbi:MBL fold metallo-hydrolase [Sulfuriflexus sp.]|uniref:MBL fold metallo-hydrolase n=1 Tax=Sulfuriflexus sp. TaxID=2015443 RepID=UPI0028CC41E9|nr:MBL fold metallo-hydrolase [Sulfuriflexus sp.]MDT8405250.1 MBL fold metallo-hydrolase [Sulfuriflexus sp.]